MIGFCFSGEGARGAVQAGVVLSLHRRGIDADYAIGISSGSACSASYAFGGASGLVEMWQGIRSILSVFHPNWNFLWNRGLLNQRPMERIVSQIVKKSPVCEGVVARLHIVTGEIQYVSSKQVSPEEFGEAALGAVAITGLVTDRNGWVDAGSRQMAPLQQCIEAGCDEIYVILGRPLITPGWKMPGGLLPEILMAYRALDLSLYELLIRDIRSCLRQTLRSVRVYVCEPRTYLYDAVMFRKCRDGIQYGLTEYDIREECALRTTLL